MPPEAIKGVLNLTAWDFEDDGRVDLSGEYEFYWNQLLIFNPFEQADNSASRKFQGTGLGLSLTRRLVEFHGGRIWAESNGNGTGSTFNFVIPI